MLGRNGIGGLVEELRSREEYAAEEVDIWSLQEVALYAGVYL